MVVSEDLPGMLSPAYRSSVRSVTYLTLEWTGGTESHTCTRKIRSDVIL